MPEKVRPMAAVTETETQVVAEIGSDYKYGFHTPDDAEDYFFKSGRGLSPRARRRDLRAQERTGLDAPSSGSSRSSTSWRGRSRPGAATSLASTSRTSSITSGRPRSRPSRREDLPGHQGHLGQARDPRGRERPSPASARSTSEVVYHKLKEDLESQGVLFLDMDSGLREHEELVKQYFGTIIPQNDNKFAALNSAVWSGGSFIYVPPGVKVEMPLQAYFRINAENMESV